MTDAIATQPIRIAGGDGQEMAAYLAAPTDPGTRGGVLLIHHLPGFDRWSKEVARRFATDGYNVIAPNLFSREGLDLDPDDAAAAARAKGGVPDEDFIGDARAAVEYLRSMPSSNGKVAVIGHCSGGRQSVLAACNIDFDAAVDCYGAFVVGTPPDGYPLKVSGLEDQLANLSGPLLGLFGNDDSYPSPEQVAELDRLLTEHGKPHEFHSYDGAGHAFFCTDRPSYRVEASLDGYEKIARFFTERIG